MKKSLKAGLSIFCLSIIVSACLKDTNIQVEKMPPGMVIHSITPIGQPFSFIVTKSANILDVTSPGQDRYIRDADIQLFADNQPVDYFKFDTTLKLYRSRNGTIAKPDVRYTLKATSDGMEPVESQTKLSDQFPIIQSSIFKKRVKRIDGSEMDEIRIRIHDRAGVANYYMFSFLNPYYNEYADSVFYFNDLYCMYTNDPDVDNASIDPLFSGCLSDNPLISDKNFDGKEKEFVFYVSQGLLRYDTDTKNNRRYGPIFQLYSLTEEDYKYRKSVAQYNKTSDNPFAEPVNIFTNIRNGFGIFALMKVQTDTLRE